MREREVERKARGSAMQQRAGEPEMERKLDSSSCKQKDGVCAGAGRTVGLLQATWGWGVPLLNSCFDLAEGGR